MAIKDFLKITTCISKKLFNSETIRKYSKGQESVWYGPDKWEILIVKKVERISRKGN